MTKILTHKEACSRGGKKTAKYPLEVRLKWIKKANLASQKAKKIGIYSENAEETKNPKKSS